MKEYLLFMRGGDTRMAGLTEQQTDEHMQKWGAYMGALTEKGHLVGGLPFQEESRLVTNGGVSSESVKTSNGEVIGGWLHIKANDFDHAIELTKDCPIFEHEGNVEIREVAPM